jgi:hypothetical protein
MSEKRTAVATEEAQGERYVAIELRLTEAWRVACAVLQHAIAAGLVMFYSKSAFGAAVRALVGA